MKTLSRNKRPFYYARFESSVPVTDEYGNQTGEYSIVYSNPILAHAYVSSATGLSKNELFGEIEEYDKNIVMSSIPNGLTESSILWIDTMPVLNLDGSTETPYDYRVFKIAESLNTATIAVSKVKVSNNGVSNG